MFTTSWRNLIKIGWSELYKILSFFYKKPFQMLNILTYRKRHFESGFCKWNNFMMLKYLIQTSIFRYSKNYGSLTHETRIKDAVNMGDLICLLSTVRTLNRQSLLYICLPRGTNVNIFFFTIALKVRSYLHSVAALHSLHSDCCVAALRYRNKVKFILNCYLEWGELRHKVIDISAAPQCNTTQC